MKALLFVPVIFVLFTLIGVNAQPVIKRYESANGYFTDLLPGTNPRESRLNNGSVRDGQVSSASQGITYLIIYTYPCEDLSDSFVIKSAVDSARKGILAKKDHKIISEGTYTHKVAGEKATKEYTGYEFQAESQTLSITYRFIFGTSISYQLVLIQLKNEKQPIEAKQFFTSFTPVSQIVRLTPSNPTQFPEGITWGKTIKLKFPEYPPAARKLNIRGTVETEVIIDEQGKVISAEGVCGRPQLIPGAKTAALATLFEPSILGGVPVQTTTILTFNFKLQ